MSAIAASWVELDYRSANGISVTLEWDRVSNAVCVTVEDVRNDSSETFYPPAERAKDAFEHPYAYLGAPESASYPVRR